MLSGAVLATGCASASGELRPRDLPRGYEQYRAPAACADSLARRTAPLPTNYDEVRRSAAIARPDLLSGTAPPRVAFLWYFVREDGTTAETRLWRSSGSREVDDAAVEAGRGMRWRPATCGGEAVATWYGHPIALGGPQ